MSRTMCLPLSVIFGSLLGGVLCVALVGCSERSEAKGLEGTDRARKLEARLREVDEEFRALPTRSAEQFAAHARLKTKFSSVKIQARSKTKARLGTMTQRVFVQLSRELDEIEEMMSEYPR